MVVKERLQGPRQNLREGKLERLAEAWWARVRAAAEENAERQVAAFNLGQALYGEGNYGEAERMFREGGNDA